MAPDTLREPTSWYDRHGQPITFEQFEDLRLDSKYWIVSQTEVPVGGTMTFWVSTVWNGSHTNAEGPPLIFETTVFLRRVDGDDHMATVKYATEAEALEGHLDTVTALSGHEP